MGLQKGVQLQKEFVWDFAVDGGAVSAIALNSSDPNGDLLDEGFVVEDVELYTETTLTSGGTPTITIGNTTDPDGYMADVYALATTAPAMVRAGQVAGALIWNTTEDAKLAYRVDGTAANQNLLMTIGTAALTAGKIRVIVKGFVPTSAPIQA
jgi:hypothetical protein